MAVSERERELEAALRRIVAIGTRPVDSMLSRSRQISERGQEMLDEACRALRDNAR